MQSKEKKMTNEGEKGAGDGAGMKGGAVVTCGAMALLVLLGLVFCWHGPDLYHRFDGELSLYTFKRHLCWNMLGLSGFGVALFAGWKWWLKWAPAVALAWCAMLVAAHLSPMVNGAHSLPVGALRIDVWACLPFAAALMGAWVVNRFRIGVGVLFAAGFFAFTLALGLEIVTNANRLARLEAFFNGQVHAEAVSNAAAFAQTQAVAAFDAAKWFSSGDRELLRHMPCRLSSGMPAAAAILFGKWFVALVYLAFGALAAGFAWLWRKTTKRPKRAYLLIAGLSIVGPAVLCLLQCLGATPYVGGIEAPLVSAGGTTAFMTWVTIGVAILRNGTHGAMGHRAVPTSSIRRSSM